MLLVISLEFMYFFKTCKSQTPTKLFTIFERLIMHTKHTKEDPISNGRGLVVFIPVAQLVAN